MRLGDLDALKADLLESKEKLWEIYNGLSHHVDKQICAGQIGTFTEAIMRINGAPTIDAVPVVRCKDCKFYEIDEGGWFFCNCFGGLHQPEADDFCSYGERKDGEQDG